MKWLAIGGIAGPVLIFLVGAFMRLWHAIENYVHIMGSKNDPGIIYILSLEYEGFIKQTLNNGVFNVGIIPSVIFSCFIGFIIGVTMYIIYRQKTA